MPPTAPPSVTGDFSAGTPTAPGAASGSFSAGTPTAPGAASGSFSAGTPTAPGAATGNFSAGTPTAPGAASGSYVAPVATVPGVAQVMTVTVLTGSDAGGSNSFALAPGAGWTDLLAGIGGSIYAGATITGIVTSDNQAAIAGKIRAQLGAALIKGTATWGDVVEIGGTGAAVTLTRKAAAANVTPWTVTVEDVTTDGVTISTTITTEGEAEVPGLEAPAAVTTDFS
jgi:hypothetical protein